jgi:hypothetical protein
LTEKTLQDFLGPYLPRGAPDMSFRDDCIKAESEIKAAIGEFIIEWAKIEQNVIFQARGLSHRNEMYNRLYGTVLQEITPLEEINEALAFSCNLETLKKVALEALPDERIDIENLSVNLKQMSQMRNDIVHRTHVVCPPWSIEQIECRPRISRNADPRKNSEKYIIYTIDQIKEASGRTRELQAEIASLFGKHVAHVWKENGIDPNDLLGAGNQTSPEE